MLQSFHLDTSTRSSNGQSTVHSCPFCRCRSLDASINVKISPRSSACNIRIAKEVVESKVRNSRIEGQNIYYRTFESPRKSGLSPNGNKKIVIQYVSPQSSLINSTAFRPFAKPQPTAMNSKTSFIISSPIKKSPRNIYTNENTPPKAKFLQKKSSRKNSQQKMLLTTPFQGLTLVDSEKVRKPIIQESQSSKISFSNPLQQTRKRQSQQISIKAAIDYYPKIPQTETKNIIKRTSCQESSASPFNSLIDSSPRMVPYPSTPQTPIGTQFEIARKETGTSIKEMMYVGNGSHREIKKCMKGSQQIAEVKRLVYTPKYVELTPERSSYSHQKFDKTLGKLKSVQRCHENQLIYSQSDKQTINYPPSSQHNLPENHLNKNLFPEVFSRSQQNIRPLSEQCFMSNQQRTDTFEMSDNFSTPKSKYKAMNKEKGKMSREIKFFPLGDNKKGRGSKMSGGKVNEKIKSNKSLGIGNEEIEGIQKNEKTQQAQKLIPQLKIPQAYSVHLSQQLPSQGKPSQPSKVYAAELAQQLDLNYDYYYYQPIHNPNLYQKHDDHLNNENRQEVRESSIEESGSVDVTF